MLGAITGDIIGSVFEFNNIKTTEFQLFTRKSHITDDSVMTMAVGRWLSLGPERSQADLERCMLEFAHQYPDAGYGGSFRRWLFHPEQLRGSQYVDGKYRRRPYGSFGNGSAMRVSGCGWYFPTLEETLYWAEQSAVITHNHPEGVKGAQATAAAIFMARTGSSKAEIKDFVEASFGYDLSRTCDEIRPHYRFNETCQQTVPQALVVFLESADFESCMRLGVSLGGDSDTLCAIAGSIAEAYYGGVPVAIASEAWTRTPSILRQVIIHFTRHTPYGNFLNPDSLYWSYCNHQG